MLMWEDELRALAAGKRWLCFVKIQRPALTGQLHTLWHLSAAETLIYSCEGLDLHSEVTVQVLRTPNLRREIPHTTTDSLQLSICCKSEGSLWGTTTGTSLSYRNPHKASYITKLLYISEVNGKRTAVISGNCGKLTVKQVEKKSGGQKQLEEEDRGPGGAPWCEGGVECD